MTDEEKLKQIRERNITRSKQHQIAGIQLMETISDIDCLLSLVKGQEAEVNALRNSASLVAFQAHQIDERIADSLIALGAESERRASARLADAVCTCRDLTRAQELAGEHYEYCPALAAQRAATAMRSACAKKARDMGHQWYANAKRRGAAFSDRARVAEAIAKELESLSIQEQEK